MLQLDEHDRALVSTVKAVLEAAIRSAHKPLAVIKSCHTITGGHRVKGRHAAMKRHPFSGICENSGRPLERIHAQLDEMEPELGYAGRVRWVCQRANNSGRHSCGGCE